MAIAIVIPARFSSVRLPEKMLLSQTGKPLIQHTYEQAIQSKLADHVIVATDDERIMEAVQAFGGKAVMTSPSHPTGSDRLAEVARDHLPHVDTIVNVQGDEPEIEPAIIDALIQLHQASDAAVGTLVTRFASDKRDGPGSPRDPNRVKAVLGDKILCPTTRAILGYQALYFSRSLIPYPRDLEDTFCPSDFFLHLGIYAYRTDFLKNYAQLTQGVLEKTEKLEQLRVLENGYKIVAQIVDTQSQGIDTQIDYDRFFKRYHNKDV